MEQRLQNIENLLKEGQMSKKDVSTILKEGTPKQRLMILAEDIARRSFEFKHPDLSENKEPLLTERVYSSL